MIRYCFFPLGFALLRFGFGFASLRLASLVSAARACFFLLCLIGWLFGRIVPARAALTRRTRLDRATDFRNDGIDGQEICDESMMDDG